jgi:uncharacterized protein (TIGR02147 family)
MQTLRGVRKKPRIFEFTDYRSFLVASFEDRKKANSAWSYQAWALKLGLKNNTSLLKIVHGSRDAGPEITEKLIEYFAFNNSERQYFEDLIRLSKAKSDPGLRTAIMERLSKAHPRRQFELMDEKRFSVISHWWFYAIRQLSLREDFRLDAEWIASELSFPVQARQVQHAIDTLTRLGLLVEDPETRRWAPGRSSLNTSDDVASEALKRFHEGVIANASIAVRSTSVQEREISGVTLSVSEQDLPKAKEFLRKMQDDFATLFGGKAGSDARVYQLETVFFPLSKGRNRKEAKKYEN